MAKGNKITTNIDKYYGRLTREAREIGKSLEAYALDGLQDSLKAPADPSNKVTIKKVDSRGPSAYSLEISGDLAYRVSIAAKRGETTKTKVVQEHLTNAFNAPYELNIFDLLDRS